MRIAPEETMDAAHEQDRAGDTLEQVARFTLGLQARDIPASAMERAGELLLDTIGIAAASAPMEAGRISRDMAAMIFAPGDAAHAATMLFDGRKASLAGAAYAAASQIDNLDGHDGYNPTKGHIGVVALPALAALGEHIADLGGPDALAALVVCYEVAGRAAIALHASVSDYHTSGAWNALGVAAMACRLRGHDADALRQALGIAEYHGPRSQMMREIANPTMLHDGSGWGALAGMSAALLAERGFTGAPAITVEAADAAPHWADLGSFWQVEHQYVKPYPVCRWAHAAIDAARELMLTHSINGADVDEVRIRSFDYAVELFGGLPQTTSQAQYSLPFAVAAMLTHGRIGLEHISGAGLGDRDVARLVANTKTIAEPRHQARYPAGRWADIDLVLKDGSLLSSGDVHARGGPERPFGRDRIVAKFMEFAVPALGQKRANEIRDAALALAGGGSFGDLLRLLHAPARN
jgi:2-methylcitrate dehydratase PrpD